MCANERASLAGGANLAAASREQRVGRWRRLGRPEPGGEAALESRFSGGGGGARVEVELVGGGQAKAEAEAEAWACTRRVARL